MPHRIMFGLQKGGVGKTTSTVAVAEKLASSGYRVLVVDFDSQGNTTRMLTGKSIYEYSGSTIMEAIQTGNADPYIFGINANLELIPAEDKLSTFSRYIYTSGMANPYAALKRVLEPIEDSYDFVFIDVGPTLGDTVINAIVYVDHIIIPVDGGDLAMEAMVRFMEFIEATREEGHTGAEVLGIAITMRDRRSKYEKDVSDMIRQAYGPLVFETEIGRRVKIKEMSAEGIDLVEPAMEDYFSLTSEIMSRLREEGYK